MGSLLATDGFLVGDRWKSCEEQSEDYGQGKTNSSSKSSKRTLSA